MHISKTRFINYIRCNRYVALDEIRREKDKAVVSFSEDDDLLSLMSEENKEKTKQLFDMMTEVDEEGEETDLLEKEDPQMDIMLPYYNQIEIITGKATEHMFNGHAIYSLDTYHQKRFEYELGGFHFYCFLDGYLEDDDTIRVFETKATTSRKFLKMTFKDDEGHKVGIFGYSPEGILMFQEELGYPVNADYYKKIGKLRDRLSAEGRYIYDILYQRYVMEHALDTNKKRKYYLSILNSEYIHDGEVDQKGKPIYPDETVVFVDVTKLTESMMPIIEADIELVLSRLDRNDASPVALGKHCQRKDNRQCIFYDICYQHIPEKNSLFVYLGGHNGFTDDIGIKHDRYDLINDGMVSATDIPRSWLTKRENNLIQRDVIDSGKPYFDIEKIKAAITSLSYPIYHLDFESFPCPLPRFKGEKPYAQSLFQYSIHIEREPGVCDKDKDNFSFISTTHRDERRMLVEGMLDVIKPDGGSIMAYNISFEKTRIKELADIFLEYRDRLLDMADRLVDLMYFIKGNKTLFKALGFDDEKHLINFYDNRLNGSFSIKKVLPIFSHLTYQEMAIGNGTEALVTYAKFPGMDQKTFDLSYRDLLEYCKQDTWAMVEILDQLRKI